MSSPYDELLLMLNIFVVCNIILLLIVSIWGIIEITTVKPVDTREVKCYDKIGHEIKNQVCIEKIYCSYWNTLFKNCKDKK